MTLSEPTVTPPDDAIALCNKLTERIVSDMQGMRESTEEAALNIGELLVKIVEIATQGNDEVKVSLSRFVRADHDTTNSESAEAQTETISEKIERQSESIAGLIAKIEECFAHQLALSRSAVEASRRVYVTAEQTSNLMMRSKLLAFNVQIEAGRIGGEEGRAISVLGEEMKSFSDDVEKANQVIAESIASFVTEMPKLEEETSKIGASLSGFSETFCVEMEEVRRDTESVSNLLKQVLDETESRNNQILKSSHDTLSHLQFQDPVSQGLQRASYDVMKLRDMFEGKEVDECSLADIADDVGHDGTSETEAGDVLLF